MKYLSKSLALILSLVMLIGICGETYIKAAETITPTIKVKYINSKTGVKITVSKAADADAFQIFIKGFGKAYENYIFDELKEEWREIAFINKNGSSKYSYTINGLSKGTYILKAAALKLVEEDGYSYFSTIGESKEKTIKIKAPKAVTKKEKNYDFSNVKVGDIITFGSYEQDDIMTNGTEDIEWIVLSKNNSQMLLLSKYSLDCLTYYDEFVHEQPTWENSALRKWLNNSFYKTAFTAKERKLIKKMNLSTSDNPQYGTYGGNDTSDRIFLLSLDDVLNTDYGFSKESSNNDELRQCTPTAYAITNGCFTKESELVWQIPSWWLRSPGCLERLATVKNDGSIHSYGSLPYNLGFGVRPAIVINLKS